MVLLDLLSAALVAQGLSYYLVGPYPSSLWSLN